MFQQQQGQDPQQDCMTTVSLWWSTVPFGTKFLFVSTSIIYGLDWPLNGFLVYFFADIPKFTFEGHLWRIFLCQFVHGQLFNLLFGLLSMYFSGIKQEVKIGTISFLIDVCVKSVTFQLIFLFIMLLFSLVIPIALYIPSYGLWNVAMVYISMESFHQPDVERQFLCFPFQIKNRYHLLAIVLFVNLFAFPRFDILAAAILGYIEYKFFNGMMYKPSQQRVTSLQNTFLFSGLSTRPDFVPYDGRLLVNNNGGQQSQLLVSQVEAPESQNSDNFQVYGGKGVKIGSDQSQKYENSQNVYTPDQAVQFEDQEPFQPKYQQNPKREELV